MPNKWDIYYDSETLYPVHEDGLETIMWLRMMAEAEAAENKDDSPTKNPTKFGPPMPMPVRGLESKDKKKDKNKPLTITDIAAQMGTDPGNLEVL